MLMSRTGLSVPFYVPAPKGEGIKRWWPSSVCSSVCLVLDPKSRMQRRI